MDILFYFLGWLFGIMLFIIFLKYIKSLRNNK